MSAAHISETRQKGIKSVPFTEQRFVTKSTTPMQKQYRLFDPAPPEELAEVVMPLKALDVPVQVAADPAPKPAPAVPPAPIDVDSKYSKFVVYVDESGDHGMQNLDAGYPVFVLAFCVFNKRHYTRKVVADVEDLKFKYFGHDLIVLHEHEIRKEKGDFKRFHNRRLKSQFMSDLTDVIEASNFILISCIIDKHNLKLKQANPSNPYHIALGFCLETLHDFLVEKRQEHLITHVVVERRGKKEDNELELEFRRMCDGANKFEKALPFDIIFADKKVNSTGLQLADLVARPVGMSLVKRGQDNRAFEVLRRKFYCSGGRANVGDGYENWGLKIYPAP
jgi:hypothetical protein